MNRKLQRKNMGQEIHEGVDLNIDRFTGDREMRMKAKLPIRLGLQLTEEEHPQKQPNK